MTTKLPSRADHVGSFLRPRSVIEAREHRSAGNIDYSELRAIEDKRFAPNAIFLSKSISPPA